MGKQDNLAMVWLVAGTSRPFLVVLLAVICISSSGALEELQDQTEEMVLSNVATLSGEPKQSKESIDPMKQKFAKISQALKGVNPPQVHGVLDKHFTAGLWKTWQDQVDAKKLDADTAEGVLNSYLCAQLKNPATLVKVIGWVRKKSAGQAAAKVEKPGKKEPQKQAAVDEKAKLKSKADVSKAETKAAKSKNKQLKKKVDKLQAQVSKEKARTAQEKAKTNVKVEKAKKQAAKKAKAAVKTAEKKTKEVQKQAEKDEEHAQKKEEDAKQAAKIAEKKVAKVKKAAAKKVESEQKKAQKQTAKADKKAEAAKKEEKKVQAKVAQVQEKA